MRPIDLASAGLLQRLIDALRRSEESFRLAAGCASSGPLRTLLADIAAQRTRQVADLRRRLHALADGREPSWRSPVVAPEPPAISLSESRGDGALLEACDRCEGQALAACDELLAAALPTALRGFVEEQQLQVALARRHCGELRGLLPPPAPDATAS